jgi:hypothetical protein
LGYSYNNNEYIFELESQSTSKVKQQTLFLLSVFEGLSQLGMKLIQFGLERQCRFSGGGIDGVAKEKQQCTAPASLNGDAAVLVLVLHCQECSTQLW